MAAGHRAEDGPLKVGDLRGLGHVTDARISRLSPPSPLAPSQTHALAAATASHPFLDLQKRKHSTVFIGNFEVQQLKKTVYNRC